MLLKVTQLFSGRGKVNHKGRNRHFITEAEVQAEQEKERKDKEWRVSYPRFLVTMHCFNLDDKTIGILNRTLFQQRRGNGAMDDDDDEDSEKDEDKESSDSDEESGSDEEV